LRTQDHKRVAAIFSIVALLIALAFLVYRLVH
jgi:hypothetical protein